MNLILENVSLARQPLRICVLGASLRSHNMGVNALASGAVKCILASIPDAEISFVDYASTGNENLFEVIGRRASVLLVNVKSLKKFYSPCNMAAVTALALCVKLSPSRRLRQWLIARHPVLRHVDTTDVAVSFAEGDSFSDIYGIYRFIRMVLPMYMALWMGKQLVLMPQTIGPFRNRMVKRVAARILHLAQFIYSRDQAGLDFIEELVGRKIRQDKARFCYDVAFILDAIPPPGTMAPTFEVSRSRPLIGLNVSGLLYMGGYTRSNMFGLRGEYRRLVRSMIDEFISRLQVNVMLVPHVFGSTPESDTAACRQLYQELRGQYGDRLLLAEGDYDQHEIKYVIGQCDFFIGSRMHSCIAGLSQCVPTVSIAYSQKFIGVMEAAGFGFLVADARKLNNDELIRAIRANFGKRIQIQKELRKRIPEIQQTVLNLFSDMIHMPSQTDK